MDFAGWWGGEESDDNDNDNLVRSLAVDAGLTKFAKKMLMFELDRVEGSPRLQKRPLAVNLDLKI